MVGLSLEMPRTNAKVEDPAFWLAIAHEARVLAEKMASSKMRDSMLSIATYYDCIAERINAEAGPGGIGGTHGAETLRRP